MPKRALQWLSLLGVIWLQCVNGTNTNFPAYSSYLKEVLSLSQFQVNNLAFASDAGKLFGFISGIASLYLPLWLVLLIGSSLGFVGYGLQYLLITNYISPLSYVHVFFLTVLAGNSICWINTVCYITTIRNFPFDHQVAVGLTTSYQGLSAKIYVVIATTLFSSNPDKRASSYLLLNSLCPLIVCMVVLPFVREVEVGNGKNVRGGFIVMFVITIATGIFTITTSLGSISNGVSPLGNAIGILILLLAPALVALIEKLRELHAELFNREMKVYNSSVDIEQNKVTERMDDIEMRGGEKNNHGLDEHNEVGDHHVKKENIGVNLMLRKVEFWLYFFVYLFGATLGLVYMNNLGQIAESRGCSRTTTLVSLSSSFGFFGRLVPSLADYFLSRNRVSRPAAMAILIGPIGGSFFLLVNSTDLSLYVSTAIIGLCTGAITSISVSATTELFGSENFSVNHNVVVANIPLGSFSFGYLASFFYRKESSHAFGKCMGTECYRETFIIWGSFCLIGNFLAWILYTRTRKFYSERWNPR